jgi:Domain of unknown function (DUF1893)
MVEGEPARPRGVLAEGATLCLWSGPRACFKSSGKWLYPLFELEDFFASEGVPDGDLLLADKIVGKAGALLIVRLGIRDLRAGIMSRLARPVLEASGVRFSFETLVDRIDCVTESILERIDDPEEAYVILARRAGRAKLDSRLGSERG